MRLRTVFSVKYLAASMSLLILIACGGNYGDPLAADQAKQVGQTEQAFSILTTSLPDGVAGAAYSTTIQTANGKAPYSFSISSGLPPIGFSINAAGTLGGTPQVAGTYNFVVAASDAKGNQASEAYTLVIAAGVAPLNITTASFTPGTVGYFYTAAVQAAGGTAPYTFSLSSGLLPIGMNLDASGNLTGPPAVAGTSTFTVQVKDASGQVSSRQLQLEIDTPLSLTTPTTLPAGTAGVAYSLSFVASGGVTPYVFSLRKGTLPASLALSYGGVLSGTVAVAGSYSFSVLVTDADGRERAEKFLLTISPATVTPLALSGTLPGATINTAYNATLQPAGGTPPYSVSVSSGALPLGIALSTSGALSGTPTAGGTYSFTATATDSGSPQQNVSTSFSITVAATAGFSVQVDATTTLATVPASFFGIHTSVYDGSLDDTSRLPALLATDGINTLRYPGGSYSDRYHWAQNSLTPLYASASPACGQITDGYLAPGTDFGSFAKTLQTTGTTPLITINYGTSVADANATLTSGNDGVANHCSNPNAPGQPQEAAAWVAYANGSAASTQSIGLDATGFDWKTVGFWATLRGASPLTSDDGYNFLRLAHPAAFSIRNWELGNEMYYNGWAGNHNFEADIHAPYIYPNGYSGGYYDSRESLAALSPSAYGTNAIAFLQAMKAVDPTIRIGVDFASPGATDPIPLNWNPDLAQAVCTGGSIDLAIIHYYPGTYNAVQPGELLSLPQSDIPRVVAGIQANLAQSCPANAANIQFVLSETSPNGNLAGGFPQPVVGLFALNDFLTSLKTGIQNIDWLELHNGTFLDEQENPGPAYFGIQLAHLLAGAGDRMVAANSSDSSILSFATVKANGQKGILLVNANPDAAETVTVSFSGTSLGSTATTYSYGVSTSQSGSVLTGTSVAVPGNSFTITVPAYTAVEWVIH